MDQYCLIKVIQKENEKSFFLKDRMKSWFEWNLRLSLIERPDFRFERIFSVSLEFFLLIEWFDYWIWSYHFYIFFVSNILNYKWTFCFIVFKFFILSKCRKFSIPQYRQLLNPLESNLILKNQPLRQLRVKAEKK